VARNRSFSSTTPVVSGPAVLVDVIRHTLLLNDPLRLADKNWWHGPQTIARRSNDAHPAPLLEGLRFLGVGDGALPRVAIFKFPACVEHRVDQAPSFCSLPIEA
jgi:hypothetical protein